MLFITLISPSLCCLFPLPRSAQQGQYCRKKRRRSKPITVVGCLQAGAQPNQFVLAATADAMAKGVAVATLVRYRT